MLLFAFSLGEQERFVSEVGLVDVRLRDELERGVHREDWNAGIDDIHVVVAKDIGDGSSATGIDLAEFGGLIMDFVLIHDFADEGEVFWHRVIAAGFATCAGVLVEDKTFAEVAGVIRFADGSIDWVNGRGDVAGEHLGVGHRVTDAEIAFLAFEGEELGDGILKPSGLSAGGADGADFFLIDENDDGSVFRNFLLVQNGAEGSISADLIVMAISGDHGTI